MKRLLFGLIILLSVRVVEARGPRVYVYTQPAYGYVPYVQPYYAPSYGFPYRTRGNAFYTQQFLGPPMYGRRAGVVVGGFGVGGFGVF